MEERELTEAIIKCAFTVYNTMGFGYLESVYEKCMAIELTKAQLSFESQKPIGVTYEGQAVGEFMADIVVEGRVIVELKSIRSLSKVHEMQLVNYLVSTGIATGLLINFGETKVEVKKKFKDRSAVQ